MKITINNKATYRVHLHESYTHPTTHFIPSKNPVLHVCRSQEK